MPIYEYVCDKCDKRRELVASIVQKYEVTCDNCDVPMWRVWHPTPAIFKGDGWASKEK
jgi:putative FmdB family regulatory protein